MKPRRSSRSLPAIPALAPTDEDSFTARAYLRYLDTAIEKIRSHGGHPSPRLAERLRDLIEERDDFNARIALCRKQLLRKLTRAVKEAEAEAKAVVFEYCRKAIVRGERS